MRAGSSPSRIAEPAMPIALAAASFLFYLSALAPGLLWGDSAKFQGMAFEGEIRFEETMHPLWVALVHPFARHLFGDAAYAANLSSALFSALALAFAFRVMRRIGASAAGASIATGALAVAHTYWFHAVLAEVYALNTLLCLLLLDALLAPLDRERGASRPPGNVGRFSLGLLFAFAAANHAMVVLWLPGFVILEATTIRRGRARLEGAFFALAGCAVGLLPFLWLRAGVTRFEPLPALVSRLGAQLLSPSGKVIDLALFAGFLLYQFPIPIVPAAAVAGWRRIPAPAAAESRGIDPAVRWAVTIIYMVSVFFAISYPVKDRYAFYLPSYVALAILAAPGIDALLERLRPRLGPIVAAALVSITCVVAPPILYAVAPSLPIARTLVAKMHARDLPGRDAAAYHLNPDKRGVTGAEEFAEGAMAVLPPRATIVADYTLGEPLNYLQVARGVRTDVEVIYVSRSRQLQVALARTRAGRDVFLAARDGPYDVEALSRRFEIVPVGPVLRLVPIPLGHPP
jgi:hypothetical protein